VEAQNDLKLAGCRVGHYTIVGLIGSGGMGHVYWGRDERLYRDVAIKVLTPHVGNGAAHGRRLLTEARALSRLSHPGVLRIYDFVSQSGRDFLVMELVPGATLRDVIASAPLPLGEVLRLGRQLADGLAAVHAAQVVHRDIKPTNLKVTSTGDLKILDFGLAQAVPLAAEQDSRTATTTAGEGLVGSLAYMAPEQLRGEPGDARSDIFSAGAVLYEMASGQMAFPQRQVARLIDAILNQEPIALTAVNPLAPRALERVVMRALAKPPEQRQQSARQLQRELKTLSDASCRATLEQPCDQLALASA